MNVLFLSAWFPYPPTNGSKLRVFNLIRGLSQRHQVTLLSFIREAIDENSLESVQQMCKEVVLVPWSEFRPHSWQARAAFFSSKPRAIVDRFSPVMVQAIEQALSQEQYDVVIASELSTAAYGEYFASLPAIFEDVEVAVLYEQYSQASSLSARLRYGLTWFKHRRYLAHLMARFDACTVVSERERQLLRQQVNGRAGRIEVIPNCVELFQYMKPPAQRRSHSLIFTGSFTYSPNYEAMCWFLNEVYPRVRARVPGVSLTITGDHADLPLPTYENVTLTGFVDDLQPLLASATVSVAPIWTGGGTRLKILEAMALYTPVVSTSKGAEGLDVRHDEHLLIADRPQDFANAVVGLLEDRSRRDGLADRAYTLVAERYNWSQVMPGFVQIVEEIAQNGGRAPR